MNGGLKVTELQASEKMARQQLLLRCVVFRLTARQHQLLPSMVPRSMARQHHMLRSMALRSMARQHLMLRSMAFRLMARKHHRSTAFRLMARQKHMLRSTYGIQVDGETASHAPRYGLQVDGESASRAPQFDLLFDGETAPFVPHVQEVFEDPIFDLDPWAKCATSRCAKVGKSRGGRRGTRAIQIKNAPKTVAPMCASELWPMLDKRVPGFLPRGLFPDPGSRAGCERVVDAFEAFKCALLQIAWMAEGGSSGELAKLACHLEVCADCRGDEGCFDVDDELAKLGFAVPGDS